MVDTRLLRGRLYIHSCRSRSFQCLFAHAFCRPAAYRPLKSHQRYLMQKTALLDVGDDASVSIQCYSARPHTSKSRFDRLAEGAAFRERHGYGRVNKCLRSWPLMRHAATLPLAEIDAAIHATGINGTLWLHSTPPSV